jgi:hypothetical protein
MKMAAEEYKNSEKTYMIRLEFDLEDPRLCDTCPCILLELAESRCRVGYWVQAYTANAVINIESREIVAKGFDTVGKPAWDHIRDDDHDYVNVRPEVCIAKSKKLGGM